MPEGDTILSLAGRLRPVLVGRPLESIETPQRRHALDRWPEKLAGARIRAIDTHGKHLFLRWDNGLTLHSHLRMSGRWRIFERPFDVGRRARAVWLVLETAVHTVVQFRGPVLELIRDSRLGYDPYLRRLGPDVLADELDWPAIHVRLRADDPTRPVADALLDQRTLAGIGNLWKNESLYQCRIDPWRRMSEVSDDELERVVRTAREMMLREVRRGGRLAGGEVFEQGGKGCRRCGARIRVKGQWDENRMTYWCPYCQK
jgi:endonuclease-8